LRVTAEMAVSIEKATKGAVRKEELRPDIFA
jgi:DNA-binding transcriptional regulator YdaS (Cro superfamily)